MCVGSWSVASLAVGVAAGTAVLGAPGGHSGRVGTCGVLPVTACRNCSATDLQLGQTCTDSRGNSGKPILNVNIAEPFTTVSNLSSKASSNLGF